MADSRATRQRRSNGEESRRKILDAAVDVAGERGYDGTSINAVSKRSGLPASSIYWHFKDKDELIAAVIERSFTVWLAAASLPQNSDGSRGNARDDIRELAVNVARGLLEAPDFLRLGLMLTLERRPEEPSARTTFLEVRRNAHRRFAELVREFAPQLGEAAVDLLTSYAVAGADGLFIAKEIGGEAVDLVRLFELHARAVFDAAAHLTN